MSIEKSLLAALEVVAEEEKEKAKAETNLVATKYGYPQAMAVEDALREKYPAENRGTREIVSALGNDIKDLTKRMIAFISGARPEIRDHYLRMAAVGFKVRAEECVDTIDDLKKEQELESN